MPGLARLELSGAASSIDAAADDEAWGVEGVEAGGGGVLIGRMLWGSL